MFEKLERLAPQVLGAMRILFGIMLVCHGAQKLLGAFGGVPAGTPALIVWIAGSIELVGGALIAGGLFTRGAAFLMSGLMAAAYFMAHAPQWVLAHPEPRRAGHHVQLAVALPGRAGAGRLGTRQSAAGAAR